MQAILDPRQAKYEYLLHAQEQLVEARRYLAWQGELVLPELGRRVVEIGCGIGNFTELLLDREAVVGVDREPEYLERLRQRFPHHPNLHTVAVEAGSDEFRGLVRFQPDSCVALNVLEHIEADQQALANMASILSPTGVIVLIVPAFPALYGPVDRNLGHYRRYTRPSLTRVAEAAGLRVRKARYFNSVGFFWMVVSFSGDAPRSASASPDCDLRPLDCALALAPGAGLRAAVRPIPPGSPRKECGAC